MDFNVESTQFKKQPEEPLVDFNFARHEFECDSMTVHYKRNDDRKGQSGL